MLTDQIISFEKRTRSFMSIGDVEPVMAWLLEPGQHVPHLLAEGHPQAEKSNEKLLKATQIREVAVKQQWYPKTTNGS